MLKIFGIFGVKHIVCLPYGVGGNHETHAASHLFAEKSR